MSLVGPRPLLPQYLNLYSERQRRRHEVRPGITGWCEIKGRNSLAWGEKLELDVWYVEHWSLRLDLRILTSTVLTLLKRKGIAPKGHMTMPNFEGALGSTLTDPPATQGAPGAPAWWPSRPPPP